jgi:hypothetical protein
MKKNRIIGIIYLLLFLIPISSCSLPPKKITDLNEDGNDVISLFDLNLRIDCDKGELSFANRIHKIRELVISYYPDIITLQEVQRSISIRL